MNRYVITAVGADRPGIVAALTEALLDLGGNLTDARAALLSGSFATMLAVEVPEQIDIAQTEARLAPVANRLGLGLTVAPALPAPAGPPGRRAVVSVYGADHPGIVHGVTHTLAEHGTNILDLSARLVGDPPIYVLGIEVDIPAGIEHAALRRHLDQAAAAAGVQLSLADADDEVL